MLVVMDEIKKALKARDFAGDIEDSAEKLEFYSHDASMFEIKPKLELGLLPT